VDGEGGGGMMIYDTYDFEFWGFIYDEFLGSF
jgi:hypothetical protein